MRVGYTRVSNQNQNPDLQLDALNPAGCGDAYHEKMSGRIRSRPELDTCLRTLCKGGTLVLWRLDRLGRSLQGLTKAVHELGGQDVASESLTESIDTRSAGGRLVFHLFGALAEFEHSLIAGRTRASLAAAKARGRKGGRKPKLSKGDVKKVAAMLQNPEITKTEAP